MSSTVIPTMRYGNPKEAISWLCDVAGFEVIRSYSDEQGNIVHAELKFGTGAIMIGPDVPSEFGKLIRLPSQVGGFETQIVFLKCDNLQDTYLKMQKNGVDILMPLSVQPEEGSNFTVRDPQGHVWSFGDYDTWRKT